MINTYALVKLINTFYILDPDVRYAVFENLDRSFDFYLAQVHNLTALFMAMNDINFEIREMALCTIGRLSLVNPAYVMPPLRKTLMQVTQWLLLLICTISIFLNNISYKVT